MKKPFQLIMFILTLFCVASVACKKEEPYMNDAIITGSDQRYCICCGGLMINFNGETRPYTGDFKLISNGADLGITEKDTFPLYVKVDWKNDTTKVCAHITITRIARR
ncbi:MAG TPA: hypothetical protein PLP23_17035 [Panacibacter sp.]|nr:hypothetical protein [Panacibacter sp.]